MASTEAGSPAFGSLLRLARADYFEAIYAGKLHLGSERQSN